LPIRFAPLADSIIASILEKHGVPEERRRMAVELSGGSASLALNRRPGLQGTFNCVYTGGMTLFSGTQRVTLNANVALDGTVTGTVEHTYNTLDSLKRTYNVTGTQTGTTLTLMGTGSWYPNAMSAVPWTVSFSFSASK